MVVGVPMAPVPRASSEKILQPNSLLRLDSWRLPAGGFSGPGRAGSEVFIDTEKILPAAEPGLVGSLSYAPSEGPDSAEAFLFANGSQDDKLFGLQRGPSEALTASTSAPGRPADERAGVQFNRLLPSPSEDERMWNAMTAAAARADRLESGLLPAAQRSSDLDIVHAARTTALTARQAADAAAQLAAAKHSALAAARTAEAEVKKFAPHQGASGEHRTRPEMRASAAPSMPAPAARRAPAAPATNAIKRSLAGSGASAATPEPPAKKHRSEHALAQQETPITDAANKMMAEQGIEPNTVKSTDHWTDPAGRKTRRGCLFCNMQKTPQWRQGPLGPKTLCNACGVRYRKEVEILAAREATGAAGQRAAK